MMFSNVTTSTHIESTPVLTLNHRHVMWALFLVFHFSFKKFPWHMLSKNLQQAARQIYWQQYLTISNNSGLIAISRPWKLLKVLTFGYFTRSFGTIGCFWCETPDRSKIDIQLLMFGCLWRLDSSSTSTQTSLLKAPKWRVSQKSCIDSNSWLTCETAYGAKPNKKYSIFSFLFFACYSIDGAK